MIFQDEFKRVINTLEDAILATDLAVYFQRRGETFNKMRSRSLDVNNLVNHSSADRSLFRGLLMTACDLGAITKPWPIQKKVCNPYENMHFILYINNLHLNLKTSTL